MPLLSFKCVFFSFPALYTVLVDRLPSVTISKVVAGIFRGKIFFEAKFLIVGTGD